MDSEGSQSFTILSPKKSALLVHGYMKTAFDTLRCPQDIIELCLKWYFIQKDKWNLNYIPEGIEIDGDTVTLADKKEVFSFKKIVGSVLISKAIDIMEWRLKCVIGHCLVIGLLPNKDEDIKNETTMFQGYGFDAWNGGIYSPTADDQNHNLTVTERDIINMKYVTILSDDTNKKAHGELYFSINDQKLEKVLDNIAIDNDETYLFGVSMFYKGEIIQLLQ